jgi:hypothetical protein
VPLPSTPGAQAFVSGLYAFASPTTSCGECHGASQVPLFASTKVGFAYRSARLLVNFNDPDNSPFVAYATNNHCGLASVCGPDSGNGAVIADALSQWATAELSSGSGSSAKYLTASITIPNIADLPTFRDGSPTVLQLPLSGLQPAVPSLSGAVLQLELVAPNPTEYRFSNPKIGGNTAAVTITGIHLFVKPAAADGVGSEDLTQGDTWDSDVVTIPAGSLSDAAPFDDRALNVGAYTTSDELNDTLTVGFDDIQ